MSISPGVKPGGSKDGYVWNTDYMKVDIIDMTTLKQK